MSVLDLRDYFAGQALLGLISSKPTLAPIEHLTTMSYAIAEKMLEQKQLLISAQNIQSSSQIRRDNVENL